MILYIAISPLWLLGIKYSSSLEKPSEKLKQFVLLSALVSRCTGAGLQNQTDSNMLTLPDYMISNKYK